MMTRSLSGNLLKLLDIVWRKMLNYCYEKQIKIQAAEAVQTW